MRPEARERLRQGFEVRLERKRRENAPAVATGQRLAAEHGLGALVAPYVLRHHSSRPAWGVLALLVSLFAGASLGGAGLLVARSTVTPLLVALTLAGAGVALGVWLIRTAPPDHLEWVHGCAGGLARVRELDGTTEVLRWERVAAVHRVWVGTNDPDTEVPAPVLTEHRVVLANGAEHRFPSGFVNVLDPYRTVGRLLRGLTPREVGQEIPVLPALGELIEQMTGPRLLQAARAALDSGQPVSFGALIVDAGGLTVPGERANLPWPEFAGFELDGPEAAVRQAGRRRPWRVLEVASIANPGVLQALLQRPR
jgi:hypothetical protein